jgi:TRAP-type mannitol/chloroaromatic compound transport system permease small subunit
MPELSFVLPHWLYWSGLVLFPLLTMLLYRRKKAADQGKPYSLGLSYTLLLIAGFIGTHRMYLKSQWALLFTTLFISILVVNTQVRDSRNALSNANKEIKVASYKIKSAEKAIKSGKANGQQRLEKAQTRLDKAQKQHTESQQQYDAWLTTSQTLGITILLLLILDAFLLPKLIREKNQQPRQTPTDTFECPATEATYDEKREPFVFNRWVSRLNGLVGEFVAYWSLLAVGVYYYEVMARYVFNSPTNWAHESMFLMFGMQYLLAGGFVLREGAHVRVDVLYMHLSARSKALVDLATSTFFFIFMLTLLLTGWTFFMDAYNVKEVSFTEWGIQYWPVKLSLSLGALLLLLQGIALLLKDIAVLRGTHNAIAVEG